MSRYVPLYLPDLLNVSPAVSYQKRKNTAPCGTSSVTKQAVRVPKKKSILQ